MKTEEGRHHFFYVYCKVEGEIFEKYILRKNDNFVIDLFIF